MENAKKELEKATFKEYSDFVYGTKMRSTVPVKAAYFPDGSYLNYDDMTKLLGKNESGQLGPIWCFRFKESMIDVRFNKQMGCFMAESRAQDVELLKEFRKKMILAYDKKHAGTIDKIKKAFSEVPGKKDL